MTGQDITAESAVTKTILSSDKLKRHFARLVANQVSVALKGVGDAGPKNVCCEPSLREQNPNATREGGRA